MDCIYLNKSASKWKTENMDFMLFINSKPFKQRKADCYESFGNFALHCFRFNGKHYRGFPRDCETFNGLPIIDLERCKITD